MARSVRAVLVVAALALPLAGCTTTQHEAQRLQLDAARQRAALHSTRVTVGNPEVTATAIGLVRAAGQTALVVTVHNAGHKAVTDLPISVGYETAAGTKVYLNSSAGLQYFQAHLPAIAAKHSLTWVYTTHRAPAKGSHLFALVGDRRAAPALLTETGVRIGLSYGYDAGADSVTVHLDNSTSVPQYQLQVYAYARDGRRYVAAGGTTVPELDGGSRRELRLPLVGTARSAKLHVVALPTILQ